MGISDGMCQSEFTLLLKDLYGSLNNSTKEFYVKIRVDGLI